jgi:glycosyltransferase involved in cell wall biosynthesis
VWWGQFRNSAPFTLMPHGNLDWERIPLNTRQHAKVAILLATHNGATYVEQQIRSLTRNDTRYTLHWLDDHSTDDTRAIVRRVALEAGIHLKEWHQSQRLGVPAAFFQLIECADADIYFFCDQDDIWQPGKIDATVANLIPDLNSPVVCFSDPLVFTEDNPEFLFRTLDARRVSKDAALEDTRAFMTVVGYGHTQGFTRALRDIFMNHKDIARKYAFMHDMWMYVIAVAAGVARMLPDAPTTLYRSHSANATGAFRNRRNRSIAPPKRTWKDYQVFRVRISRHAAGFLLAAPTLRGPRLEHLLAIARLVSVLDRRQSPVAFVRLARLRAILPSWRFFVGLAAACIFSNANE